MYAHYLSKLSFIALLAILFAHPAWARSGDLDIQVIDRYGQPFAQYPLSRHKGPKVHRAYLEATKGEDYAIRVRNRTDQRIGLVIAVDGRNIISGDKSYLAPKERMYILGPYQQAVYKGWRTSKNQVNRFYFTDAADSYADAWGDHSAMGVIAVAAFREQHYRAPYETPYGSKKRSHSDSAQSHSAPQAESKPGTGFGEEEWSRSRRVSFEPEGHPIAKHFIKYEWRDTLCRKGIIQCYREHREPKNRFWKDQNDYAPYPPSRNEHK